MSESIALDSLDLILMRMRIQTGDLHNLKCMYHAQPKTPVTAGTLKSEFLRASFRPDDAVRDSHRKSLAGAARRIFRQCKLS